MHQVLIANNGIAAVKAIRSIRRWAFEMFQVGPYIVKVCGGPIRMTAAPAGQAIHCTCTRGLTDPPLIIYVYI